MGDFLSMDKDEDNTAVGRYLRIKVRIDIRKPLMRGVTLCVGKEEKSLWCPVCMNSCLTSVIPATSLATLIKFVPKS
jgi:ferredoxin